MLRIKIGPEWDPWGTPEPTDNKFEKVLFTFTFWDLLDNIALEAKEYSIETQVMKF